MMTSRTVRLRFEPLEDRRLLNAAGQQQTVELFGTSPALFVENQGQWADESVQFLHQGNGANVAMTDAGPVFQLFRRVGTAHQEQEEPFDDRWLGQSEAVPQISLETTQFSVAFDGANLVSPVGMDRTETYFNYLVGEQDAWRSGVSAYETVAYENLYDGIDLLTWGQRDSLKYEFHVAPGADYHQIQISYDNIDGLWLDTAGALHVLPSPASGRGAGGEGVFLSPEDNPSEGSPEDATNSPHPNPLPQAGEGTSPAWAELIDEAPYIYQQLDGQQIEVPGRFTLIDAHTYTFTITGDYDASTELIIDPDLAWSTYLGGNNWDEGRSIAVDTTSNTLVTGTTRSPGWVSSGFDTSFNGSDYDAFVVKLSPTGDHLWSTYLGGDSRDYGRGIAVDTAGSALVTGQTESAGWVSGGADTSYNGRIDVFVAKLTATGTLAWSTYLGGSADEKGYGIAVDASGNALVTGLIEFPGDWVSGGFDTSYNGGVDAYMAKLGPSGSHVWSTFLGGSSEDYGYDIAVDVAGNVLVTGSTRSPDWVSGGFDISHNGGERDVFVARINLTQVTAQADAYDVDEDQTLDVPLLGVLENDTHSQGHALTATLADGPDHGTLSLNANGSFTFIPDADFNGTDSFTYLASDGDIDSNEATVTITVNPVNDTALAVDDTYTTDVNLALSPPAPGLLGNDEDVDGDSLTASIVTEPAHYLAFQLNSDGSFAYFPETGYLGPDRFTYKVNDGTDDSDVATVWINVGAAAFYPGDADLNGVTDVRDFMLWNVNKFTDGTTWEQGDFDGNGVTDVRDFMIWNLHKFTSAEAPAPQVVDEPAMTPSLDRAIAELAWQLGFGRENDAEDETISAVDKLLATYWR